MTIEKFSYFCLLYDDMDINKNIFHLFSYLQKELETIDIKSREAGIILKNALHIEFFNEICLANTIENIFSVSKYFDNVRKFLYYEDIFVFEVYFV